MKKLNLVATLACFFICAIAFAEGPSPLQLAKKFQTVDVVVIGWEHIAFDKVVPRSISSDLDKLKNANLVFGLELQRRC